MIEEYRILMDSYARDTRTLSFTKYNHPAYIQMRTMGGAIIPLLLEDIKAEMGCVWAAISLIFDICEAEHVIAPVIPDKDRGVYDRIRSIVLEWGEKR